MFDGLEALFSSPSAEWKEVMGGHSILTSPDEAPVATTVFAIVAILEAIRRDPSRIDVRKILCENGPVIWSRGSDAFVLLDVEAPS